MLTFRTLSSANEPLPLERMYRLLTGLTRPGQFFVRQPWRWLPAQMEELPWEVFRGRLLEPHQTRETARFLAWNLVEPSGEPVLSVKWSPAEDRLFVVRSILCRVWEPFDAGSNVIETREATRWIRELVGTIALDPPPGEAELQDELISLLWHGVVGTSRLPLHSLEAPLPGYTLGQLGYLYREAAAQSPMTSWRELLEQGLQPELNPREQAKLLELLLRGLETHECDEAAAAFAQRWQTLGRAPRELLGLVRRMFNEVSLSPYTGLVDHALRVVARWVEVGVLTAADEVHLLAFLLTQLTRHLTAYDLVLFHHRGANYPDALFLDALLDRLAQSTRTHPELFEGPASQRVRRALRQGCLLRWTYEGHAVPSAPTSPGENARVWPDARLTVPPEQIDQPRQRPRHLYQDRSTQAVLGEAGWKVVLASLHDLHDDAELAELGLGLFIDRPLGYAKATGEPDHTPLLAHEAFSATLANRRLLELAKHVPGFDAPPCLERLRQAPPVRGVDASFLVEPARPVASLADVRRVADDFVIVRTLPGGLRQLWEGLDWGSLPRPHLLLRGREGMVGFDAAFHQRFVVELASDRFRTRAGVEWPVEGLTVLQNWSDRG